MPLAYTYKESNDIVLFSLQVTQRIFSQSPQPAKAWTRRKLAREDGNKCVQYNLFLGIHGEEDCLYLNVYTPKVSSVV